MKLPIGKLLQNGKYRIERVLGQGSFGITYLASVNLVGNLGSIPTDAKVAIKELFICEINGRNGVSVTTGTGSVAFSNFKDRFIKEARNLSRLNHPHIVHVLELFEENNTAYYVMEYLEGGSLDKLIADKKHLTEEEAVYYIRHIAEALDYMHANRMLHLDLKPANIVLSSAGEPVIIDFGLTKMLDPNGEQYSSTAIGNGTPGYAPLEQYNYQRGKKFSVTMDVYALGATFYKMLFGQRPPDAVDLFNEGVDILNLQTLNDRLLQSIIAKAMAPRKGQRYQSVRDFIDILPSASKTDRKQTENEGVKLNVEVIEKEDADTEFPQNTISLCLIKNDDSVVFYFRGTVYADFSGGFLRSLTKNFSYNQLRNSFEKYFKKYETMSFERFISSYHEEQNNPGQNIYWMSSNSFLFASYLKEDDFFKSLSALTEEDAPHFTDLMRENNLVASFISRGNSDKNFEERIHRLIYENTELGFEYGDGVCDLYVSQYLDEPISGESKGETFTVESPEQLKIMLLGGMLVRYFILKGIEREFLLIDAFPFDIDFGPKWGEMIPKMLPGHTSLPTRKVESFDLEGTDLIGVRIGDREYTFKPADDFGYLPKNIECDLEFLLRGHQILFTIKDKDSGKEVEYKLSDFISKMKKKN